MQLYLRPTCKRYAEAVVVGLEAEPDNLAAQPFPVLLVVQVIVLGGLVLSSSPISRLLEERTHVAHLCLGLAIRYPVHTVQGGGHNRGLLLAARCRHHWEAMSNKTNQFHLCDGAK